jgi:dCMP deaminase
VCELGECCGELRPLRNTLKGLFLNNVNITHNTKSLYEVTMILPVNTLVAVQYGENASLWHFSHYDAATKEYHVFADHKTSMTAFGATIPFTNIVVWENSIMPHDGYIIPASSSVVVIIHRRNGKREKGSPDMFIGWIWDETNHASDIIAFQILGDNISQPDMFSGDKRPKLPEVTSLSEGADTTKREELFAPPVSETRYDNAMMNTAYIWSRESKCKRLKVGAVLAIDGRIIMNGYNGTVAGTDNCCEEDPNVDPSETATKPTVLHAEKNLTLFCERKGISAVGTTLYLTASPCAECAELIIKAGIRRVVFSESYRCNLGIEKLRRCNVRVDQVSVQYDLFNQTT